MRYLAILFVILIHLDAVAQQGRDSLMKVDIDRVNAKLHEFTYNLSSGDNRDLLPRGIILRGAYRMYHLGQMANNSAGSSDAPPTLYETPTPAEDFVSSRSLETILDACSIVSSKEELGTADLVRVANLLSLAEQVEHEELQEFYEQKIAQLDPAGKREVDELISSASWKVNYTRLDWAALVADSPDVAEFLIRHTCANTNRLIK